MSEDKEMSEEEVLRKHLESTEKKTNQFIISDIPIGNNNSGNTKISDSSYFHHPAKDLPCGDYYLPGTLIMVRPAKTVEIQDYSMVDDNNFYDVVEKMNNMLHSCVRVNYSDGRMGTY